ncbi:hypothetical protein NUSPORA_00381 [Nucleospora cyclopteri]
MNGQVKIPYFSLINKLWGASPLLYSRTVLAEGVLPSLLNHKENTSFYLFAETIRVLGLGSG